MKSNTVVLGTIGEALGRTRITAAWTIQQIGLQKANQTSLYLNDKASVSWQLPALHTAAGGAIARQSDTMPERALRSCCSPRKRSARAWISLEDVLAVDQAR